MSTRVFSLLTSAGVIATAIAVLIVPRLEDVPQDETVQPVASVNTVQPDGVEGLRRSAVLAIRSDGHYWARTLVNRKASVDFMVDTGASTVAVTQDDARKMGLRPDDLTYDARIRTAGGETFGAYVTIESMKIGTVEVKDVQGIVMKEELTQSLLGMSFLRELYSYEFRGDRMIIRQ